MSSFDFLIFASNFRKFSEMVDEALKELASCHCDSPQFQPAIPTGDQASED